MALVAPGAGGEMRLEVAADMTFQLDGSMDAATLARQGDDLVFSFENGGSVVLTGFFEGETGLRLGFEKQDGTLLTGKDFLTALAPDLVPAAGEGAAGQQGSGVGDYADDAGNLIGGVDRLDGLGPDAFAVAALPGLDAVSSGAADASGGTDGGGGGDVTGPEPASYHARLVVSNTSANSFEFTAVDADGNLITDASRLSLSLGNASGYFNEPVIDPATGKIVITLTPAGLAALAAGETFDDILTVSIDGNDYPMHLVGNGSGPGYDYVPTEAGAGLPGPLQAEWYASDGAEVGQADIILGGVHYNQVDISQALNGAASPSVWNSHIDTTAGARAVINIHNENAAGSAYGMRTYAATGGGDVASSIKGGDNSTISISAESGTTGAFGLVANTQGNTGPEKTVTTIEGGSISFDVAGVQNNVSGIYAAVNADVRVTAKDDLEFRIESTGGDGKTNAATAATATGANGKVVLEGDDISATVHAEATSASGFAASGGAVLSLSTSPSGTLQVHVTQDHSSQRTYDMAKGGGFTATGLNARNGSISVASSDIDVSATVTDAQNHGTGTAAALYAGWQGAKLEITGQADQANRMAFAAEAPDYAFGAISTNDNARMRITGGDHDDVVTFSATAENRGAFGIAAQAGGTLTIDGGAGNDAVRIDATFTGQGPKGEVDLFGG
jgi:hypothetical protein